MCALGLNSVNVWFPGVNSLTRIWRVRWKSQRRLETLGLDLEEGKNWWWLETWQIRWPHTAAIRAQLMEFPSCLQLVFDCKWSHCKYIHCKYLKIKCCAKCIIHAFSSITLGLLWLRVRSGTAALRMCWCATVHQHPPDVFGARHCAVFLLLPEGSASFLTKTL